jgi:hypothetical protein
LDGGKEGCCVFGVTSGDAAPALEVQEGIFDQMAQLIEFFVIFALNLAIFLWRNYRLHALQDQLFKDGIGIIAFVRQQHFRSKPVNQQGSLCAIRNGTCCDKYSDRHTMRIHGQMYLGVKPPFVRLMSWFPPFAPAA